MATVNATDAERQAVIDGWLDYVKEVLAPSAPGAGGNLVERKGDTITVRTQIGSATFALISCTDESVDYGAPLYPERVNVGKIGDAKWR
jgi:hypothetical protein